MLAYIFVINSSEQKIPQVGLLDKIDHFLVYCDQPQSRNWSLVPFIATSHKAEIFVWCMDSDAFVCKKQLCLNEQIGHRSRHLCRMDSFQSQSCLVTSPRETTFGLASGQQPLQAMLIRIDYRWFSCHKSYIPKLTSEVSHIPDTMLNNRYFKLNHHKWN